MSIRDKVQAILDRRHPAEKALKAPAADRWAKVSKSWSLASSFAASMTSRLLAGRVKRLDERTREVSCTGLTINGEVLIPPCPALAKSESHPGKHYCNECGCGDKSIALIDGDGYPKLAYPSLECPRRRDGFSNALPPHFTMEPTDEQMLGVFDRVVVLNLARRRDRLVRFYRDLPADFPFRWPQPLTAIDGEKCPFPDRFTDKGRGTWGCLQSHRRALEDAINDGVGSILIFEDDAHCRENFRAGVVEFLRSVPSGWDCLMLGGGHIGFPVKKPVPVNTNVLRCINCQRMHAYAVRGPFMLELYKALSEAQGHCDHVMGPLAARFNTYAPVKFLVGQDGGRSDISGRDRVLEFWDEPLDQLMEAER